MSTPQRWNEVKALLAEALETTAERRAELLAAADPELASQVKSYLALDTQLGDFIERPAFDLHDDVDPAVRVGERLGPYRLAREIGSGGMGAVYQAVRADEEYEHSVAIKVLKRGLDTAEVIHRFRNERQILAGLEHPHVARLMDGGTTPDGRPYLVMEYVEGQPIDLWCHERGLSVDERLELFLAVCEGVKFAHRNLVVHRDLKPSNILITEDGTPKLLDFGIARLLDTDGPSLPTVGAWRFLTPEYASPEQVTGQPITTATDVYSLGILLYLLLTDRRPYDLEERSARGLAALFERGEEPARPSTVAPEERRKRLRGDLDNIALTALRREPERRYGSAGELADDVRRHVEGLPVKATPDSWRYRAGKFVKRHRVGVAAAVVIGVLLVGFTTFAWIVTGLATAAEERAQEGEAQARESIALLEEFYSSADPDEGAGGRALLVREVLDNASAQVQRSKLDPMIRATLYQSIGKTYLSLDADQRDKAKPLLKEALEIRTRLVGGDDPLVAETLEPLALYYRQGKNLHLARLLLSQALTIAEAHLPSDDRRRLSLLNNLAVLEDEAGRFDVAERIHRRVLAQRRAQAPDGDPLELAASLHNLANALHKQRKYQEAEGYFREALALRRENNEKATRVSTTLNGSAANAEKLGDPQTALELYSSAENLLRSHQSDHPKLANILNNKGLLLLRLGYRVEAETVIEEAVELKGTGHPTFLRNLAVTKLANGKVSEAKALIAEINRKYDGRVLPEPWRRHDILSIEGELLVTEGRYQAAEPLLLRSYDSLCEWPGPEHPNTEAALERVIHLYEAWGRSQRAADWRSRREAPTVPKVEDIEAGT